jgi:hypothetical protein
MILLNKKICKNCNKEKYIFAHHLCQECYKKLYSKSIKKKKIIKQNNLILSQKKAFLSSFLLWDGKNYLTGKKSLISDLKYYNFAHVLDKKNYQFFKYFPNDIVILTLSQHFLFDNYTEKDIEARKIQYPEEDWIKLFNYKNELLLEYTIWIENNPHIYKL